MPASLTPSRTSSAIRPVFNLFSAGPVPVQLPDIELLTPATATQWAAERIGADRCIQGFKAELAALPGEYAEPQGALRLARIGE